MDRTALYTLIGDLTADPIHDRYTTSMIDTELDNTQDAWNLKAAILTDTVTLTTVDGTRQYALTDLTGTPIGFRRVTHRGIELLKKDKSWLDLYAGDDWSDDVGTPDYFVIEASDPDLQYITLYPTPRSEDAGANLVVEYIKRHTSMSNPTDTPFNNHPLLTPYHWGTAYDTASRLLMRDPTPVTTQKVYGPDGRGGYMKIAGNVLAEVVQTFRNLERETPLRLRGGRSWRY